MLLGVLGGMGGVFQKFKELSEHRCVVFNYFFEQALLPSGGAEPGDHGLERRTSLEWGHGGHCIGPVFFEI